VTAIGRQAQTAKVGGYHRRMASAERFRPAVTVAAVIEQGGRYLLVEEHTDDGLRLNNPAGHLEAGESPLEGVVREALEETARAFAPQALVGVYLARPNPLGPTYLRFAFCGPAGEPLAGRALDQGIVRTLWMTPDEVLASRDRHRSPLVARCIADHAAGRRYPLELVFTDPSVYAA
jgi:8-oxo-dGTP pyrophosphatase MutT (NUDIX family)